MKSIEILKRLKDPFPEKDIEWRMQSSGIRNGNPWGKVLAYVTARAVQDRLDEVLGLDGWSVKYEQLSFRHNVYDLSARLVLRWRIIGYISKMQQT
jgi:hypothetical protein